MSDPTQPIPNQEPPRPVPPPGPIPEPKPVSEPEPDILPDELPNPNPDENIEPPKHARRCAPSFSLTADAGPCVA